MKEMLFILAEYLYSLSLTTQLVIRALLSLSVVMAAWLKTYRSSRRWHRHYLSSLQA
jgi:hypothetical protein